jgi:hypothetical protein
MTIVEVCVREVVGSSVCIQKKIDGALRDQKPQK